MQQNYAILIDLREQIETDSHNPYNYIGRFSGINWDRVYMHLMFGDKL